jgi:RNA polymerase sigma factor (sigma-70 family)
MLEETESPFQEGFASDSSEAESLFLEMQPVFRRITGRLTTNREMRQDLIGESYLNFRKALRRYDPGRGIPLKVYLACQVRFHLYTLVRARWQVERRHSDLESVDHGVGHREDPSDAWDDALILRHNAARVAPLLERISVRQKRAITWRYYNEMSYDEIALRLGVQTATARSLLRHGICRLRELAMHID